MFNLKSKKKSIITTALLLSLGATSMVSIKVLADTPEDHDIKNYTFTKPSEDAKPIPAKGGVDGVILKADSTIVVYKNGETQEYSNKDYYLKATIQK